MNIKKLFKTIIDKKIPEYLYYLAIAIFIFTRIYSKSVLISFSNYDKYINAFIFLCLIIKVCFERYNKKDLIINTLIFVLGIFACIITQSKNKIAAPLMFIGLKNTDIKKIIKISITICASFVIYQFIVYIVYYLSNGGQIINLFHLDKGGNKNKVLCDDNNNYSSITVLCLINYVLLDKEKNKYITSVIILLFSLFIYAFAQSTTCLILSILIAIYYLVKDNRFFIKNNKYIKILFYIFVIFLSFSFLFINTESYVGSLINKALTGRPCLSRNAYNKIGIPIIMNKHYALQIQEIILDNNIINLVYRYGLLFVIAIIIIGWFIGINNKTNYTNDCMIPIVLLWAITETWTTYIPLSIVPMVCMWRYYNEQDLDD